MSIEMEIVSKNIQLKRLIVDKVKRYPAGLIRFDWIETFIANRLTRELTNWIIIGF